MRCTICQKHIKECKINNEFVVSILDLDFLCIKHDKDYNSYCEECQKNLCEICLTSKMHKNHKIYLFKDKLLDKEDNKKIDNLLSQGNLTNNRIKNEIEKILNIYSSKFCDEISMYKKILLQS